MALTTSSGKFYNRIPRNLQERFTKVCQRYSQIIDYAALFDSYNLGEKLHCLAALNITHPAPCLYCGKPTKKSEYGFTRKFCSVTCRSSHPSWLEQRKKTCLDKYGTEHAFEAGRERRDATNSAKYGGLSPFSSANTREKARASLQRLYGVDNISKSLQHVERRAAEKRSSFIKSISHEKNLTPLFDNYRGLKKELDLPWRCNTCGFEFISRWENYRPHCPKCEPKKSSRTLQGRLYQQLRAIAEVKFNDRTVIRPHEIDLLFTTHRLAIEINGFYWHRINDSTEQKREKMKSLGYKFMMFFEDEVEHKSDIVISMIKHKLGLSEKTISARKCTIEQLSPPEAKQFLLANHLSGAINASCYLGLRHGTELVALAAFGKNRFHRDKQQIELLRFCTARDCSVVGGFSRLISHYKRTTGIDRIISFADRRLDPHVPDTAQEQKNGFIIWDNRNKIRLHRLAASKKNMAKYVEVEGKTQKEIMESLQWFKIPSLGVFKYEL